MLPSSRLLRCDNKPFFRTVFLARRWVALVRVESNRVAYTLLKNGGIVLLILFFNIICRLCYDLVHAGRGGKSCFH